jgi:hypothetical protein
MPLHKTATGSPRPRESTMDKIWYVSYGSNMCRGRFECYLSGGVPAGGNWCYPGCRDSSPPRRSYPMWIPGRVYFAGLSLTWGGGMAFLDPDRDGRTPARGYLISTGQFADICAQEMRKPVGATGIDVAALVERGRLALGPGRYETLLHLGDHDGVPMATFTAPQRIRPDVAPATNYLATIEVGLNETFDWPADRSRRHLAALSPLAGATDERRT